MADTPANAVASYGEGVKWLVGLSSAAVAGAFLHFDQLAAQIIYIRVPIAVAIGLFTFSIWGGVYYLLWLNTVALRKESKKEIIEELKAGPSEDRKKTLETRFKAAEDKIELGESTMPSWHVLYTRSFGGALLLSGLVLVASLALHKKPTPSTGDGAMAEDHDRQPNHFVVTYSAIHKTAHGNEAHTFLLDQSTGDLWQMTCAPNNQIVFRHVERIPSAAPKK